jgi:NAD(P)-dependent dehydrogenase (short-subunit alcohol dehydrogenase family)
MKNILIVGASKGIGKASAGLLKSNAEYRVYGTSSKSDPAESVSEDLHLLDVRSESLNLDFLPETLHGLVYCPGAISLKPFARIKPDDFAADYALQLIGAVKVIQAALPRLKLADSASIVLFSTVAVQTGFTFHSLVSSSKGAIEGLCRALAAELAPHIRVNCIAPSITNTGLAASLLNTPEKIESNKQRHPLKKIGEAIDIAHMVEFLISDKSSWITARVLHIDGGISSLKV